jgi:hypothetical protein
MGRLFDYFKFLVDDERIRREFSGHPTAAMSLNILTTAPMLPAWALPVRAASFGWDYSWRGERVYPISGGLVLTDGCVRLSWDYDPNFVGDDDMQTFLSACVDCLFELAELK